MALSAPTALAESTFLKVISGELTPNKGTISMGPGERMSVLEQNHFKYDDCTVLDTVLRGHEPLYKVMKERTNFMPSLTSLTPTAYALQNWKRNFQRWTDGTPKAMPLRCWADWASRRSCTECWWRLSGKQKVRVLLAQALLANLTTCCSMTYQRLGLGHRDVAGKLLVRIWEHGPRRFARPSLPRCRQHPYPRHWLPQDNPVCRKLQLLGTIEPAKALRQQQQQNKKWGEEKGTMEFIQRFKANVAKSKQTTSRKKMLEKLNIEEIQPSSANIRASYHARPWPGQPYSGGQGPHQEHRGKDTVREYRLHHREDDKVVSSLATLVPWRPSSRLSTMRRNPMLANIMGCNHHHRLSACRQ